MPLDRITSGGPRPFSRQNYCQTTATWPVGPQTASTGPPAQYTADDAVLWLPDHGDVEVRATTYRPAFRVRLRDRLNPSLRRF